MFVKFLILSDNAVLSHMQENLAMDIFSIIGPHATLKVPYDKSCEDYFVSTLKHCIFDPANGKKNDEAIEGDRDEGEKERKAHDGEKRRRARFWMFLLSDPNMSQAMSLLARYPACQEISTSLIECRATRSDPKVCPHNLESAVQG